MESEKQQDIQQDIPVDAVCEVLDYYWKSEVWRYRGTPTSDHILHALAELANWVMGISDWTAADYAAIATVFPFMSWSVGSVAEKPSLPEASLPITAAAADATWEAEGPTRYRLPGLMPHVQVVVGWDGPLSTYFAQVWEVPEGEACYERGNLLLWLGLEYQEIDEIDDFKAVLAPFVTLPEKLTDRLARHMALGA